MPASQSASILVPLDGSSVAERALPMAAKLAQAYGAPLRYIHVLDEHEGVRSHGDIAHARELFAAYIRDLADRAGLPVAEGSIDVAYGSPAESIIADAHTSRCIVIASHGRGGFHATFIGSVADKVVRGADVPVLVVSGASEAQEPPRGGILVALDGSSEGERALPIARELGKALKLPLTLIQSFTSPPLAGAEFAYYPPTLMQDLQEGAEAYLASTANPGETRVAVSGAAAEAIEQAAADMDASLVVMATSGKGLAKRVALGSTSDRVLHALRRPLLLVPPEQ
ncbi:MAG: universal stress protein [Chloroflexi bacterium]|nr:universal stress protein [Chloroflexota bacterium]